MGDGCGTSGLSRSEISGCHGGEYEDDSSGMWRRASCLKLITVSDVVTAYIITALVMESETSLKRLTTCTRRDIPEVCHLHDKDVYIPNYKRHKDIQPSRRQFSEI